MALLSPYTKLENGTNYQGNRILCQYFFTTLITILFTLFIVFPSPTTSDFAPSFVWSAINKSLEEDRLMIVDANNDKVKIKGCVKVVLFNEENAKYAQANYSGKAVFVQVLNDKPEFATDDVENAIKEEVAAINPGRCIPCLVVISIVNLASVEYEKKYKNADNGEPPPNKDMWDSNWKVFDDYQKVLSENFDHILRFGTPMQARHLILVRLVEKKEDLTKCHGKKYTMYPRRLVPIWEQVLFSHFKDARVIQGVAEESGKNQTTLITGKESGMWVWMCEEVIHRLELQHQCSSDASKIKMSPEKCQKLEEENKLDTAAVVLTDSEQCRAYRPRT